MMTAYVFLLMTAVYAAPNMRPRSRDVAAGVSLILAVVATLWEIAP